MLVTHQVPWQDPIAVFSVFSSDPIAALLHSDGEGERGRWSYIAASPFHTIKVDHALQTTVDGKAVAGDPFHVVKDLVAQYRNTTDTLPVPFQGGAVGFFSYDLASVVEQVPRAEISKANPLLSVGLYDVIAAFDHHQKQAWVLASGFPEQTESTRRKRATDRAAWMCQSLAQAQASSIPKETSSWASSQSRQDAEQAISQTIDYIRAGDIFQANITQRFIAKKPAAVSPWNLFRRLRTALPSPFGAYISAESGFQILSASPERFLRVSTDGCVETRPIKGTRPRGENAAQDLALMESLKQSDKDRAENLMIVDLMRNDLSRVCEIASIAVPQCNVVETFAQVHHLVSVVTGRLQSGKSAVDLLRACFPGGSVSGAPKVRAMEVIHELEPSARGPYCGAIAWIGFDGAMDSSIVIRSLIVDGDSVLAHAGGGIVSDSDPALEYEEAMVKIRPLLSVLTSPTS